MSAARLSGAALDRLPEAVQRPAYDRAAVTTGIVHIGLGAFFRAHGAVYTDDTLAQGDLGWGIVGASLRSPDTRDALAPQDGLYTVATRDASGERLRVVGSVRAVLVAPEGREALLALMAQPTTRIVSLTITEKAYARLPASGELDEAHPDVRHDLANPHETRSALGLLTEALARRRANGAAPFTILSCDNLPANGAALHQVLTGFASLRDPDLGRWVADEVRCPSTMVDRIVPATTDADRAAVSAALGVEDAWPVVAEPFSQWVVEDAFPLGRPAWDAAGATLTADVAPWELAKLRLLNGSHSTLACLGLLAGHETVADVIAAPGFAALIEGMMAEEITPTLPRFAGFDPAAYRSALLRRFRNPALRHRTAQIATDGSQKLPQRLLGTVRERLARGGSVDRLLLGVAGWMQAMTGRDDDGRIPTIADPLAGRLRDLGARRHTTEDLADAVLAIDAVFGTDLPASPVFRDGVVAALTRLREDGAARTVAGRP